MNDNLKLGSFLTVSGVGMLWMGNHESRQQMASRRWPSALSLAHNIIITGQYDQ